MKAIKNTTYKLALLLFSGSLLFACNNDREREEEDPAEIPVAVAELKRGGISSNLRVTGTVLAISTAELSTEANGTYQLNINLQTRKPYALGDRVKKGAALLTLKDREYENDIRIETKKKSLELNKGEFEKQQSLYDKGGVTLRELKTSESNYLNAQYDYEKAEIMLAKLNVRASFNGVITDLPHFTNGVKVPTGTKVVSLMDDKQLYLEGQLQERYFSDMKKGLVVTVSNYNQEQTLSGKLTEFSPAIDPTSRTFKVKMLIDNQKGQLKSGMFVKANVSLDSKNDVITVPKEILLQTRKGQIVYVVEKKLAKERVLELGLENDDFVEVKTGLKEGDRLVVKGYELLTNEAEVKVLK